MSNQPENNGASAPLLQEMVEGMLGMRQRSSRGAEHLAMLARGEFRKEVASTPKELVWAKRKSRLYHYFPLVGQARPEPVLIVPWIGISRPLILDLLPDNSLLRALCGQGYHTYLLDWGEPGEEDGDIGFEECALDFLPRAVKKTLAHAGAKQLSVVGVCLGVPTALSYLALTPDAPVRSMVAMVGPIDFDQGGMFKAWVGGPEFPAEAVARTWGGVPTSAMGLGFKLLRPFGDLAAYTNLLWNIENREYLPTFQALNDWANDFIPMPGKYFVQLSRNLYRDNQLVKGEFRLDGRRVDLSAVRLPLLVVAAAQDHIAPAPSVKALMDVVSSTDKEYVELPGGHISVFAGRRAAQMLFPKITGWLSAREPAPQGGG